MQNQYVVVEGNTFSVFEEQQLAYQIADEALITHSVILSTPRRNIFDAKFTVEFRGRSYPLVVAVKKIDGIYDFFSSIADLDADGDHDARKELMADVCNLLESPSRTDFVLDEQGLLVHLDDAGDISADVFSDIVGRVEAIENAILAQNPALSPVK